MSIRTISDIKSENLTGKYVILRSDLNTPIENGKIMDTNRIEASIPTIEALSKAGAKLIILAHLGRPDGKVDPDLSLKPIAEKLSEMMDKKIQFATDITGQDALARIEGLTSSDILMLENIRFDPRETSKSDTSREELVEELLDLLDSEPIFVSDGFGVVHRKQASVYDIAKRIPSYAGFLVEAESKVLQKLMHDPERPYTVVLGGSKVSDKLDVINSLITKVDKLIIVGAMAFTFIAAKSFKTGTSIVQDDYIEVAKKLLSEYNDKIVLPVDIVVADKFAQDAQSKTVEINSIPDNWMGLDIGEKSVENFEKILATSKTIFWNGPAGVYEFKKFEAGTKGIAQAIVEATKNKAFTVIGGGDSAAAVFQLGFKEEDFSHISTGGGASLEFLEGKTLPGLEVLS